MELRRYWQIILKRRITLLMIIGIIAVTVILGTLILSPVYSFESHVWVKNADPKATLTGLSTELASLGVVSSDLVMFGQLVMIKNLSLIQEVIDKLHLVKWNGVPFGAKEFLEPSTWSLLFKKKGIRLTQMTSSQIILVSGFSNSPQEAAEIANTAADGFVNLYNQNIQASAQQALRFIQESVPKVSARLKQAEDAMAEYKVANHINNITYYREKLLSSLATLKEDRDGNESEVTGIEKRIAQTQAKLKKIPEFQKSSMDYHANATLEYLRQKLMDAEATLASGAVKATPEYVGQKQTQSTIEKYKREYKKQADKLFYGETIGRNSIYTTLVQNLVENEINLAVRTVRRQVLKEQITNRLKELDDLTLKELAVGPMAREVTALQSTFASLLTQEQTTMLATNVNLSNAQVVERAVVPPQAGNIKDYRWFPKRKLLLVLSIIFGLLLGMATIFCQEYMDDTLSDTGETEGYLNSPVLACLPELPPLEPFDLQSVMANVPWAQAMWALPDMVKVAGKDDQARVWAVTSTNAGEGKTLVAASLGWVLALRGQRVLLLDLNDLHPSLPSLWQLPPGEGVREILQGTASLTDCLKKAGPGELYLLPNGRAREIGWSQLDPKVLAPWLATVKAGFDTILLDLPAVGAGEGAPLAALGEQTLMVVAANHSPRTEVARALEQIQRGYGRIGGLVFNRYQNLEFWPLAAQDVSDFASWPPVHRLLTFVQRQGKSRWPGKKWPR